MSRCGINSVRIVILEIVELLKTDVNGGREL